MSLPLPPSPRSLVSRWAVSSQLRARRNALVANTQLAQRRAERLEVEAYLAHRAPAPRRAPRRTAVANG